MSAGAGACSARRLGSRCAAAAAVLASLVASTPGGKLESAVCGPDAVCEQEGTTLLALPRLPRRLARHSEGLRDWAGDDSDYNDDGSPCPKCNLEVPIAGDPVAFVEQHKLAISSFTGSCKFVICFESGVFQLHGKVFALDSTYNRHDGNWVVWTSTDSDRPAILSGGAQITKWRRCDDGVHCVGWPGVWFSRVSELPQAVESSLLPPRTLWSKGQRVVRAEINSGDLGLSLMSNHAGYYSSVGPSYFSGWVAAQVEARWPKQTKQWSEPRCVVTSTSACGPGTCLHLEPACWEQAKTWNYDQYPPVPAFFENVPNFAPPEGRFHATPEYIFYHPHGAEPTDVWLPTQEKILTGVGLSGHTFKGLQFRHGTWRQPSAPGGYVAWQTGVGPLGEPEGVVTITESKYIRFLWTSFVNIGGIYALSISDKSQEVEVLNSRFVDCSGGALKLGNCNDSRAVIQDDPSQFDVHYRVDGCTMELIGREFRDCAALFAGFVRETLIKDNTITDTSYTGISLGWGWGNHVETGTFARNNHILGNKLLRVMQELNDGGCIYTLGPQPGSSFKNNYCQGNPAEQTGFFYFDNGSKGWITSDNVASGGPAPCLLLQGCCNQPAYDIKASRYWCQSTGAVRNECEAQGCTVEASTVYTVSAGAAWPALAQSIIHGAGARDTLDIAFSLSA